LPELARIELDECVASVYVLAEFNEDAVYSAGGFGSGLGGFRGVDSAVGGDGARNIFASSAGEGDLRRLVAPFDELPGSYGDGQEQQQ
jgi:hypothetical protein